ncbi:MAG: class I SAM-dependent methyltransferase [Acidobacteriia bacterium]|nr:class I SAM-dependent methyltransferase [Terriglobia bacterium]
MPANVGLRKSHGGQGRSGGIVSAKDIDLIRSGVDSRFYLDEIARSQGKGLEMGVGTGRLFAAALKNGADIHGLDLSRNMIEILRKRLPHEDHSRL